MPKFQRRWSAKTLLLYVTLLLVILFLYQFRGDRLDKAQRRLAGANAIDCGIGHLKTLENNLVESERSTADACAVAAFKAGKPYRVRYDNRIDDWSEGPAIESTGSVRTPQGQVYFFYYLRPAKSPYRQPRYWLFYLNPANWKTGIIPYSDYQQAVCPAPVVFRKAVGCGTCSAMAAVDSASCILHP